MGILIKAKGMVDVERLSVQPGVFVYIEDGKIAALDSLSALQGGFADAEVIDLSDEYILPGLINSHLHLGLPGDGTTLQDHGGAPDSAWLMTAIKNARTVLRCGITTVRDCGDRNGMVREVRKAIAEGVVDGPEIVQAGDLLTITGGHASEWALECDGVDAVTRAVRFCIRQGSDFIKMMQTGGGTPGTHPECAAFNLAELSAAVEVAHNFGKQVTAHCRGVAGIRIAVQAGVDQIEHCCFEHAGLVLKFDAALADEIAAAGISVSPTIQLYREYADRQSALLQSGGLSPEEERLAGVVIRSAEEKLRSLRGLVDAGVTCMAGDDAGIPIMPFDCFWLEMDAMVAGGMSPLQAIASATIVPARKALGRDDLGSLAVGKQADIIAVPSDPSQDIKALASPSLVMRQGKAYRF